jgi:uncharacterized protein (DUF1330 family)
MNVVNNLHPGPEQAAAFFSADDDGPMCMLNLLKFKEKADYGDPQEPPISGREAYMRYSAGVVACLAAVGGKIRFSAEVTDLMIGETDELWDMVAIAEYPSRAALLQMIQSPEYQSISKHRVAGLAGQLNIRTKAIGR